MELPFLGASQPGDTYYFSPLKINVFGIVDCSIFGGSLGAHVYDEGQGKKGGNNVASLLIKEIREKNLLRDDEPGKEITIIMDNCSGQNKNNMVLRLALFLVEAKYFKKVTFMFYIVGHTKNAADRWFNMLKKTYRRSNLFTYKQLLASMKTHERISVRKVNTGDFQDFNAFLNSFYKKLESGTVMKNHIFTVEDSNPTTLLVKLDNQDGTAITKQEFLKRGTDTLDRYPKLRTGAAEVQVIPDPGIPDIKRVELFTKYRPLILLQFQDITCPHPGDKALAKIKSE